MKKRLIYLVLFALIGCVPEESDEQTSDTSSSDYSASLPEELEGISRGLNVSHNVDTVFATINTKDPEKWGKYQLQFTTSISTSKEEVKIVEFGGYLLQNREWVFQSIYNRPFNTNEFEKWYSCPNALVEVGKTYSDSDNWLGKSNQLDGRTINALWYFIGETANGERVIGISEVVGVWETE